VTFKPGTMTITLTDDMQRVVELSNALPDPVQTWTDADGVAEATTAHDALTPEQQAQLPQPVRDALANAQQQAGPVNHADEAGPGSAASPALPWQVRFMVAQVHDTRMGAFADKLSGRNLLALYDLSFVDTLTGQTWQPPTGASVNVTLNVSGVTIDDATRIGIAHQQDNGTLETIAANATTSGVITFAATSFSLYGVTALIPAALSGTAAAVPALHPAGVMLLGLMLMVAWRRQRRG
jgi:hypothetical protein